MSQRELDHVLSFIDRMVQPRERPLQPPEPAPRSDDENARLVDAVCCGEEPTFWQVVEGDYRIDALDILRRALALPVASPEQRWALIERQFRGLITDIVREA